MGLFTRKDPVEEYRNNRKFYLEKIAVQKPKGDVSLHLYKAVQEGKIARMYVKVREGHLQVGDLLQIEYLPGNKLGVIDVFGSVKAIYQVLGGGGFGKQEQLQAVSEAFENDLVWVDVPGVEAKQIYINGVIRKAKAKNTPVDSKGDGEVSISHDAEVSGMVNYFKTELYGYFAQRSGIGHVTQDLGYSLMAQKKRLDKMGITMVIERSDDIGAALQQMEVRRYSSSQYDVAEADEAVKLRRTYHTSGRIIYQDNDWRICHYLLAGAKYNNTGMISCPSCGNYASREELLTGCPYCGTQFQIRDLSLRVAGYSQKQIEQSQRDRLRGKIDLGYALYHESQQKEYDQVLKHRMVQVDPLFSPTAFYNSMRNKLYSIVFAENEAALKNLADEDFDVAPFYGQFANVIDIDIQGITTKEFKKNDPYILVDAVMDTMVLRYYAAEGRAEWTREMITMSFVKHVKNQTKNIFEPGKIHCLSCGGSYSLYEGKACSYCGHEVDYLMYDWLLIDLSVERNSR